MKDPDEECILRVNNWSPEMVGSYIMVVVTRAALNIMSMRGGSRWAVWQNGM